MLIGIQTFCREEKTFSKDLLSKKLETEWTEYPVLHFDMSLAKHLDKEKLNEYLSGSCGNIMGNMA